MVTLSIKDIKKVPEKYRDKVKEVIEERHGYYSVFFKKYDKPMVMEVIFKQTASLFTVSVSLNMKSKKVLSVAEGNEILPVVNSLFSGFKKAVKKQYELEKKEYLYKRKRKGRKK